MNAAMSNENTQGVNVLIVANFASTDGSRNCRFNDLARRLSGLGAAVELVTSNFEHDDHTFRDAPVSPDGYKLTLVHERGYSKNISVRRLISQYTFGKNLEKYLAARDSVPDVIYCAMPSPDAARVCAQYAKQHGIPFVVDIQDLWPEAFGMRFRAPRLIKTLFHGMTRASRTAYEQADLVVGVSQTYVSHAERTVGKTLPTSVVYLGASLQPSEEAADLKGDDRSSKNIRIAYAGTLSHSYDLPTVIDAMELLGSERTQSASLELVVLGDGPMRTDFEDYARQKNVQATFFGRLPYPDMLAELRSSDIAVNPIVAGSAGSVLNKVGDYAAAGIPVVNTQESPEYRELLDRYEAGLNCATGDSTQVATALRELVNDPVRRAQLGRNNRRMAEEIFDREKTYAELAEKIIILANGYRNTLNLANRAVK